MTSGINIQRLDWRKKWRVVVFLGVGLFNTGAFFVLANVLAYLLDFGPRAAAYISYALLIPVSFLGHRRITFGSNGNVSREWIKFCFIQLTNILIIAGVTQAAETFPMLAGWVSFAIISILIPALNFVVFQLWVFSNKRSS